jgi:ketosteroid isomerase-like protein
MRAAFVLAFVVLMVVPLSSRDRPDALRSAVLALDAAWQQAIVDGDVDFIKKHTHRDFTFIHAGQQTAETKGDWIRKASAAPRQFSLRRVNEQSVEIHGDVAIVFGKLDIRTGSSTGDAACYSLAYAHLYERKNKLWLFLSHVTTQVLKPENPCSQ